MARDTSFYTGCFLSSGELHCRPDPRDHGQKVQHQKHVCDRPCGPWKINFDRFPGVQGWHHRLGSRWGDQIHGHKKR